MMECIFVLTLLAGVVAAQVDVNVTAADVNVAAAANPGTTSNIQQIFVGRCWDYDATKYLGILPRVNANCDSVWSAFFNAFSYKDPCNINQNDYKTFVNMARQALPKDKVMFWSGTFQLAHDYGQQGLRYITLEDTLIGYLANSLIWCGQKESPGMNFTSCPAWDDCPLEASESFWGIASKTYAEEAIGRVYLMVNGSNPDSPAYRQNSFFAKYELPNLDPDVVPSVNVMVAHDLGKPRRETCGTGSLVTLQQDVTKAGLAYTCEDDPPAVMHLLCADSPSSTECQQLCSPTNNQRVRPQNQQNNRGSRRG